MFRYVNRMLITVDIRVRTGKNKKRFFRLARKSSIKAFYRFISSVALTL